MLRPLLALGLAFLTLAGSDALAQDKKKNDPGPWKYGAVLGVNLSQSAFSDNWAGGDLGSVNWVANTDLSAKRQISRRFRNSNTLQLAYGQTARQVQEGGGKVWDRPEKTTDLILFESVGRFTLDSWADPYIALRLDSQFIDESNPIGQLLFNPIKLTETAGVARAFVSEDDRELVSRVGFGFRQSIARTFIGSTTDATESFTTNDGGFEWTTDAKYPLAGDKIQYKGKLQIFLPVFFSSSDDLKTFDTAALAFDPAREQVQDFWRVPDVNFQNSFDAKITEWLAVNLYLQWVYDKFDAATNVDPTKLAADVEGQIAEIDGGIRKAGQFRQTLALAISYRFL